MSEHIYLLESKLTELEEKFDHALILLEKVITTKASDLDYKLLCQRFIEDNRHKEVDLGYTLTEFLPEDQLPF